MNQSLAVDSGERKEEEGFDEDTFLCLYHLLIYIDNYWPSMS